MLGIVPECAAQGRDGLVYGIRRNHQVLPNHVEQPLDTDDLAGTLREADEDLHGSGLELDGPVALRNLIECGVDAPLPEPKNCIADEAHRSTPMLTH
jgi:hypothetical protein